VGELAERRSLSTRRLSELREHLKEAEKLAGKKACVYATGSLGRLETGAHSDLDLFIVGKNNGRATAEGKRG
jgi:glutamine synthetase adenylyltransferase